MNKKQKKARLSTDEPYFIACKINLVTSISCGFSIDD